MIIQISFVPTPRTQDDLNVLTAAQRGEKNQLTPYGGNNTNPGMRPRKNAGKTSRAEGERGFRVLGLLLFVLSPSVIHHIAVEWKAEKEIRA